VTSRQQPTDIPPASDPRGLQHQEAAERIVASLTAAGIRAEVEWSDGAIRCEAGTHRPVRLPYVRVEGKRRIVELRAQRRWLYVQVWRERWCVTRASDLPYGEIVRAVQDALARIREAGEWAKRTLGPLA
jgi:hypothetical protein